MNPCHYQEPNNSVSEQEACNDDIPALGVVLNCPLEHDRQADADINLHCNHRDKIPCICAGCKERIPFGKFLSDANVSKQQVKEVQYHKEIREPAESNFIPD